MNHPTTYAVDLAKSVFEIAVSDRPGHVHERHRLARDRFLTFFAHREPATVLLEACGSAHHWARELHNRGDSYLRTLLIHGARSVLWSAKRKANPDPLLAWALNLERTRRHNKAAVALANKLARITWAVWRTQRPYERRTIA